MYRVALALSALSCSVFAQSLTPGTTGELSSEASALFAATTGATVTAVSLIAEATTLCGGPLPEETQWGLARGFRAANGFALSTGWIENGDQENPPTVMFDDPFSCADANGAVGNSTFFPCTSVDPVLAAALSSTPFTRDAAIYSIDFTAAAPTTLDVSYNFVTFESPTDITFYDSFAILLDGVVIAGGKSNGGPEFGTDPWVLSPSQVTPSEYGSLPAFTTFVTPAHETGLRTVTVALTPGAHVLEYHVADGAPVSAGGGCNDGNDNVVDSLLFGGLHTYRGATVGAHTPGLEIGRIGHPTQTGGPHGDDLQISLQGAPAGALLFLFQSPQSSPGFTIPLLQPLLIVIGLAPYQLLVANPSSGTGLDVFPAVPPVIPVTVSGRFHYQWWGLGGAGFFNSAGMQLVF